MCMQYWSRFIQTSVLNFLSQVATYTSLYLYFAIFILQMQTGFRPSIEVTVYQHHVTATRGLQHDYKITTTPQKPYLHFPQCKYISILNISRVQTHQILWVSFLCVCVCFLLVENVIPVLLSKCLVKVANMYICMTNILCIFSTFCR